MIGFLDSGIGGVYVLKQCLKMCPNASYVYLADNKFIPYGNRSKRFLIRRADISCKRLVEMGCDVIVFACNTLTAVAIKHCRNKFKNIKFVGIEPAVKPALSGKGKILVLLTSATFRHSVFLKQFKANEKVVFSPQKCLAEDVEKNRLWPMEFYFKKEKYESVVLGCTHYNVIREDISKFLGVSNFFEASDGVALRLRSIIAKEEEQQKISFIFTGKDETERYFKFLQS